MTHYNGLSKVQLNHAISNLLMNVSWEKPVDREMKATASKIVPVRTGKLLDTILSTMGVRKMRITMRQFTFKFEFEIPQDRPDKFTNKKVAHLPPQTGYGIYYKSRHKIPNVHPLRPAGGWHWIRSSKGKLRRQQYKAKQGQWLYQLDDPTAEGDYKNIILNEAEYLMEDIVKNLYMKFIVNVSGDWSFTAQPSGSTDLSILYRGEKFYEVTI